MLAAMSQEKVNTTRWTKAPISILARVAVIVGGCAVAFPVSLHAEDIRGQGVAERSYEEYSPLGVRLGSFVLRPSLTVSEFYDDNVFATVTDETDDFVTEINPNVRLESDWANHSVVLELDAEQSLHASETNEDTLDMTAELSTRIDALSDTSVTVGFLYGSLSEERGSPDAIGAAAEPTEYEEIGATVGLAQRFNRVSVDVSAGYTELDFDDTPLIGGGFDENDDRDRSVLEVAVQVGYELVADTVVFLRGTYNVRDYDQEVPVASVDRDSDGYEIVAGTSFELGSLATGEVYAGYQDQTFEDPSFAPVSSVAFGAAINWFATPLTTVRLRADSSLEDTSTGGSSSFERRSASVGVDHEFLRNLVASADFGYAEEDFSGSARQDTTYDVELGVDYLINRAFSVGAFYGYEQRDSTITGDGFSRNVVGLRVKAEL
jgi:hypothetical protein